MNPALVDNWPGEEGGLGKGGRGRRWRPFPVFAGRCGWAGRLGMQAVKLPLWDDNRPALHWGHLTLLISPLHLFRLFFLHRFRKSFSAKYFHLLPTKQTPLEAPCQENCYILKGEGYLLF